MNLFLSVKFCHARAVDVQLHPSVIPNFWWYVTHRLFHNIDSSTSQCRCSSQRHTNIWRSEKNWIEIYFARCQILFLSLNQFGIKYYFGKWVTRNMFLNMDVWEHGWKVQERPFVTWQCLCRERWSFFPQSLLLLKEPTISHKCVLHPTHHRCHQRRKYTWNWYLGENSIFWPHIILSIIPIPVICIVAFSVINPMLRHKFKWMYLMWTMALI